MAENAAIARPYAQAVFELAQQSGCSLQAGRMSLHAGGLAVGDPQRCCFDRCAGRR